MSIERKPKRMVDIDLFTHPKMRGTSAMAKALFVFLLLPSPSGINCLSIRQMRLMVDAGATDDQVRAALGQLCDVGVVRWDPDNEVVWVVKALERQAGGASPKIGTCVAHHLDTLPPSPLLDEFRERYHGWLVRAGVIESENEEPVSAPSLRLVSVRDSEPDTLSRYPIQVPYGISDTDTDTETDTATEPVKEVEDWSSSREETARENRTSSSSAPPSRDDIETAVLGIVIEAGIAGTCPGPSFASPAVERVCKGEATLDDVRTVTAEYARRKAKGDSGLRSWQSLFYDGQCWARTQREYLLREVRSPSTRSSAGSATTRFIQSTNDIWGKKRAERAANPAPVLSDELNERLHAEGSAMLEEMGWS